MIEELVALFDKKTSDLESKLEKEVSQVEESYQKDFEAIADQISAKLAQALPDYVEKAILRGKTQPPNLDKLTGLQVLALEKLLEEDYPSKVWKLVSQIVGTELRFHRFKVGLQVGALVKDVSENVVMLIVDPGMAYITEESMVSRNYHFETIISLDEHEIEFGEVTKEEAALFLLELTSEERAAFEEGHWSFFFEDE